MAVGSLLADALLLFVFFGGAGFLIGLAVETAVRARKISARCTPNTLLGCAFD